MTLAAAAEQRDGERGKRGGPRDPTMRPFVVPGAAGFPQKGAFSGNIQKFNLSQQRKVCWIVQRHKGTVFPQEREVLRLERGFYSCLSGIAALSRRDRSQRLALKGESREKNLFMGIK